MSNAVWAMATLQRRSTALCEAIAGECLERGMAVFAPQAISNMVWGFAVLDYNHPAFMKVCPERRLLSAQRAWLLIGHLLSMV